MDALPPPSNPEKPEEKQGASESKNSEIKSLINALIDIEKANSEAESAERKRTHKRETWHTWMTVGEIILVAVYAFFTVMEWRTFDSERQTMEKENILDQRAWVYPDQFAADTTSGLCTFRVSFKNSGKTPALNANAYIAWVVATNIIPTTDDQQNAQMRQTMPPNTEITLNTPTIPKIVMDTITNGTVQCWVLGTVWYDDIFTNHHWNQFCYLVEPDLRFAGTRLHHASDPMSGGDGKSSD